MRLPLPGRVLVEGADGIDRGELVERRSRRRAPGSGRSETRARSARKPARSSGDAGGAGCRRHQRDERVQARRDRRLELSHPEPRRQQQVHELEPARARRAGDGPPGVSPRAQRRTTSSTAMRMRKTRPGFRRSRRAGCARAARPAPAPPPRATRRSSSTSRERPLELVEGAVLREHEPSGVDQRAVGAPALPEVARVLAEDVVGEHGGDAQLVAAADVQVEALRVGRARREARVEGWLALDRSRPRRRRDRAAPRSPASPTTRRRRQRASTIAIQPDASASCASRLAQSSSSLPRSSAWPAPTLRSSRFSSIPFVAVERHALHRVELDRLGLEGRLVERQVRERLGLLRLAADEAADGHVAHRRLADRPEHRRCRRRASDSTDRDGSPRRCGSACARCRTCRRRSTGRPSRLASRRRARRRRRSSRAGCGRSAPARAPPTRTARSGGARSCGRTGGGCSRARPAPRLAIQRFW